jgi:Icc-related predicted phosphoesterase
VTSCFFASDLHGRVERYRKLFRALEEEAPAALLLGGDLFPSGLAPWQGPEEAKGDFLHGFLFPELRRLRQEMGSRYPRILTILGNDDPRSEEVEIRKGEEEGLLTYVHDREEELGRFRVFGYAFVPPTPFLLKDWERYDVSRYVPPGSVSPEEGSRTVEVNSTWVRYGTIKEDLEALTEESDLTDSVFLFHTPPHETRLDRAALDGKSVDHVPLDVHVGSIAVRRFIQARQPRLTLHGHIHESARLTGSWRDTLGETPMFSAAHDGPELALVRFDLENPATATRELL